jgi:hypothetical protein
MSKDRPESVQYVAERLGDRVEIVIETYARDLEDAGGGAIETRGDDRRTAANGHPRRPDVDSAPP